MGCKGSKAPATKPEEKPVPGTTLLEEPTTEAKGTKANEGAVEASAVQGSATESAPDTAGADVAVSGKEFPPELLWEGEVPTAEAARKEPPAEAAVADAGQGATKEEAADVDARDSMTTQPCDSMTTQTGASKEVEVPVPAPALAPEEPVAQLSGEGKATANDAPAPLPESNQSQNAVDAGSPSRGNDVLPEAEVLEATKTPASSQFWCLHYCLAASGMESQAEIVVEK